MIRRLLPVILVLAVAPAWAEQARSVPDARASFALSGDQRWVVLGEFRDGEAAIGIAREAVSENPKVQVARSKDGGYAILSGPQAQMTPEQLKEKFTDGQGLKNVRQSQGEEFVARAWQFVDGRLASAEMQEGKAFSLNAGAVSLNVSVLRVKKGKEEDFFIVGEGREDGKAAFTTRSELLYTPLPVAKAALVKLEGPTPQAVIGHYTGGAHCCIRSTIVTKGPTGKWQAIKAGSLDGDYGPMFEDLDGDGTPEMLSGDNRFLYQFDSYAASRMPAKIEKLIGGKIVDVTRRPEYRRYHVQYLAALEARAEPDDWTQGGFLAAWVAQKVLLGEGAEAFERAQKSHNPASGAPFETCTVNRPLDKCPESRKKTVKFVEALRTFLDKSGYR